MAYRAQVHEARRRQHQHVHLHGVNRDCVSAPRHLCVRMLGTCVLLEDARMCAYRFVSVKCKQGGMSGFQPILSAYIDLEL